MRFAPYAVHPLAAIDFARQIPKTSDQRQMERWQRIGVYSAGLALSDAGILGEPALLDRIDLAIAAGNGERDLALDGRLLETVGPAESSRAALNQYLIKGLRPTLYLGQLSNLLAGNISIVHKATGSSRTFKGEEMAGVAALEDAVRRLGAGQSELILVGGALNAEREDLLLNLELGGALLHGNYRPV
jgi:3-oxoacyl-[acyl-carrier-protein] synthase II